MSVEGSSKKSTELQALGMAKRAGIELTPEQIDNYITCRRGNCDNEISEELSIPLRLLCDQRVLYHFLTGEERIIFRLCNPVVFQLNSSPERL